MSEAPVSVRLELARGTESDSHDMVEKRGPLMAWALHAVSRRAVYILTLPREHKGLACNCVCPACGSVLQAVNNGRPADHYLKSNTLRPFFRHHTGQQQSGCLVQIARLAALRLFIESREIILPAPSSRRSVVGASGTVYTSETYGEVSRSKIIERNWVDEHSASIKLEDGRIIFVTLAGTKGEKYNGTEDAVISIKVDDPEVSTWPPEKIMEMAQLDGKWMCWERHWEDDALNAEAMDKAEADARNHLDLIPADFHMPDGLTPIQRSESLLHWLIKEIIAAAGNIRTPEVRRTVARKMPDGRTSKYLILLPEMVLLLSEVRLEQNLGRLIPDVMCRAADATGKLAPFDLLIEVAVTHKVSLDKQSRIQQRGLACIEIDVDLMVRGGRLSIDALREIVLTERSSKRWINHPALQQQEIHAEAMFDDMASDIAAAQARETWIRNWFDRLTTEQAAGEYLNLLRFAWRARHNNDAIHFSCSPHEMAELLAERGIEELDKEIMSGADGLLRKIDSIREISLSSGPIDSIIRIFKSAYESEFQQKYITWIFLAIRVYSPTILANEMVELEKNKELVKQSIDKGEQQFARPTQWDKAVALMFPEMTSALASQYGTTQHADHIARSQQEEERRAEKESHELKRIEKQEFLRQSNEQKLQEAITDEIQHVCLTYEWGPMNDGIPLTADAAFQLMRKQLSSINLPAHRVKEIVRLAWAAREKGYHLQDWMVSMRPKNETEIRIFRHVLESSWLIMKIRHGT